MTNRVVKRLSRLLQPIQSAWDAREIRRFGRDLPFSAAATEFPGRSDLYRYMHHHYLHLSPPELRAHREYFKKQSRGFGEDAFHAMWFTLLREFQPRHCLEIGVYRGQVISLWAMIARSIGFPMEAHGISPFTSSGDEVSAYLRDVAYLEDTLANHQHFGLDRPVLTRAYSTDLTALQCIASRRWDLTYIDGNHDYEVALADYKACRDSLADGGLLVMDDSSMYTDYRPSTYSTAGHPGPSRVVQEYAMKDLHFIGGVGHNNVFMKVP